jgi:hypothetical protein
MGTTIQEPTGPADKPVPEKKAYTVFVAYNGVEKEFTVKSQEPVQVLLNEAIKQFHLQHQPHLLSLWTTGNVELPDSGKLGELGIGPDTHLLLRPGAVKGGAR